MTKVLAGRIALITGASRGIGGAVAKRFAAEGAHVILIARTVGGLEETDDAIKAEGGSATLVPLDLAAANGIEELGQAIANRFKRLDILIGNAGVLGTLGPAAHMDVPVWERAIAVNLNANWRLIRSFDPLLRESDAPRAIFVTSGVTRGVFPYWSAYAASKAALETLVKTYAAEVAKTKIRVNLLDPGVLRTKLRAEAFPGENQKSLPPPESVADSFLNLALPSCQRHGEIVRAY